MWQGHGGARRIDIAGPSAMPYAKERPMDPIHTRYAELLEAGFPDGQGGFDDRFPDTQ